MCANVELMFYGYLCTGMEVGCAGSFGAAQRMLPGINIRWAMHLRRSLVPLRLCKCCACLVNG